MQPGVETRNYTNYADEPHSAKLPPSSSYSIRVCTSDNKGG